MSVDGVTPAGPNPPRASVGSRLWPVLVMLVVLPVGAKVLEAFARGRGSDVLVIPVHARAEGIGGERGDGADPITFVEQPLDEDHGRAREAMRRGDVERGLALFAEVAARHPAAAAVAVEHGFWLLNERKQAAALAELRRAEALAPDDHRVALHLGRALRRAKELDEAERELRRALVLRPGYGAALFALGGVLLDAKRADEARTVLEQASATGSNEDRARAYVALGEVHLEQDRPIEAATAFDKAVERAPARIEVRLGIARAYLNTGKKADVVKASAIVAVATELAPDLPEVWTMIGRVREALDDEAGADEAYARALHLDPTSTFARRRLLRLALEAQHYTRARGHAEQLLKDDAAEPEHHFLAGLVAAREERFDDARGHYRRAIEKAGGGYPEAWFNLGAVERDAGALPESIAAYQKALELRPAYAAAANNLGLALAAADKDDEADAIYRALLERDPEYTPAWINLGKLCSSRKQYVEAVAAYEKALALQPDHPRALLDLGVAQARMGKPEEAVVTYRRLLDKNPRSVSGWYNLALALDQRGLALDAVAAFDKALELDPDHVPSLKRRAARDAATGNLEDAARRLANVLDLKPQDIDARLSLADIHRHRGDAAACEREARGVTRERSRDEAVERRAAEVLASCRKITGRTE